MDWKALKMANLLSLGVTGEEEECNSLVRPADYVDNTYTVYLAGKGAGYLQYLVKHLQYSHPSLDALFYL